MAERKNTHGLTISNQPNGMLVDIGDMEIWDGADLSLIRDTLTQLILKERRRAIAIQMRTVKYVPSGFFGMLYDWFEQGVSVWLVEPQPRVANMLWFQRFFQAEADGWHALREDRRRREREPASEESDVWQSEGSSTELTRVRV